MVKSSSRILLSLAFVFFVGLSPALAQGLSFYVSTTGNDANPGTITDPWRTIQHAANVVTPGSTVYVRGGLYHEKVSINVSGSAAGGYITFQSYPGETAVLDGTGLKVPADPNGMFFISNQSYIVIKGFEIRNYKSAQQNIVPAGIFIQGAGSNIRIRNNRIHDIQTLVRTPTGGDAFGLVVYGTRAPASINNLIIDGNELYHLKTGSSESLALNGNVQNWRVTNNIVHDNNNIGIDAIGFEGTAPDPAFDQARDGYIGENTVYNIDSFGNPFYGTDRSANGIYVDGGTRIIIERNLVHHTDIGIEMASEHHGRVTSFVTARNNLVYRSLVVGISIGGYASSVGGTQNCQIVNNTLYDNDTLQTGSGEFQIQYHATNNLFENNILYANSQALFINNFTTWKTPPAHVDYNLYFSSVGADNSTWLWNNVTYSSYSSYVSGTGNDGNSPAFSDPKFLSLGTIPDLRVQSSSPAVDAGDNSLGAPIVGTVDYAGQPRAQGGQIDIGAYQQ